MQGAVDRSRRIPYTDMNELAGHDPDMAAPVPPTEGGQATTGRARDRTGRPRVYSLSSIVTRAWRSVRWVLSWRSRSVPVSTTVPVV